MKKVLMAGICLVSLSGYSIASGSPMVKTLQASSAHGGLVALGASFDHIREEAKTERCLQLSPAEMLSYESNYVRTAWDVKVVSSHEELSKFYKSNNSVSGNGTYSSFTGSGGYSSQITRETHFEKDTYAIAGLFVRSMTMLNAVSSGEMSDLKPSAAATYHSSITDFRNRCGDGYISNVIMGAMAQFSLRITAVNGSTSVTKSQALTLQADIKNYGSGSGSSESTKTLVEKYRGYSLEAVIVTAGIEGKSELNLLAMDINGLLKLISDLKNDKYYSPVPIYSFVNNYKFSMPDIQTVKPRFDAWLSVAHQLESRCFIFNNDVEQAALADALLNNGHHITTSCYAAASLVDLKMGECSDANKFSQCDAPVESACQSQGIACSDVINGDLIPSWSKSDIHKRYAKKFNSGRTHVREFDVCLPDGVMFDVGRGDRGYYRTSNNRNHLHSHVNTSYRCDKTTFSVKSKGGINFSSDIYLYGLKAYFYTILH
ncbi:hypothetical protein HUF18_11990 [Thalassolituus sp. ST750PaO-4]|uniref:hypothetical protein n=1 Tax=Thalassolituus sp. ST750PaO-4 TaxID=2742965 RepID=UPI000C4B973C|nr:hypothetical protein [Thalassolituus sp. ST750PaO-4]MCA6060501.1 hypothetical protein [Thalassolituus sp. ST750PaO-4]PIQ38854.1 MAG: hypothetical protein COW58_15080 [Thalassolituus sp. CG17_big_fil_post_rev_8_21_14_2_50_53_8]